MNLQTVREQLIIDEGLRLIPYHDTAVPPKLTIGVGRNLEDVGISKDEALYLLDNDIKRAVQDLDDSPSLKWWRGMTEMRQNVLVNMCFNLGLGGLLKFKKALAAMEGGRYDDAADEMRDSAWAKQVGGRAVRLVSLMRAGS